MLPIKVGVVPQARLFTKIDDREEVVSLAIPQLIERKNKVREKPCVRVIDLDDENLVIDTTHQSPGPPYRPESLDGFRQLPGGSFGPVEHLPSKRPSGPATRASPFLGHVQYILA
jgi:hypothetical protein